MRKIVFILFILLLYGVGLHVYAQRPVRQVIASGGGGTVTAQGHHISYTIGEPVIGFVKKGVAEGFQHISTVMKEDSIISYIAKNETVCEVRLFPNPVIDRLTVTFSTVPENATLLLRDLYGRTLQQLPALATQEIDMNGYTSGYYLLSVVQNNQFVQTFKIIKQ